MRYYEERWFSMGYQVLVRKWIRTQIMCSLLSTSRVSPLMTRVKCEGIYIVTKWDVPPSTFAIEKNQHVQPNFTTQFHLLTILVISIHIWHIHVVPIFAQTHMSLSENLFPKFQWLIIISLRNCNSEMYISFSDTSSSIKIPINRHDPTIYHALPSIQGGAP